MQYHCMNYSGTGTAYIAGELQCIPWINIVLYLVFCVVFIDYWLSLCPPSLYSVVCFMSYGF